MFQRNNEVSFMRTRDQRTFYQKKGCRSYDMMILPRVVVNTCVGLFIPFDCNHRAYSPNKAISSLIWLLSQNIIGDECCSHVCLLLVLHSGRDKKNECQPPKKSIILQFPPVLSLL